MTARKVVTSRIIAEVWDRSLAGIPGSEPVSRHRTLAAAHIACVRANYLLSDPDGAYPTPDGKPPCVVYAIRTHDRCVEVAEVLVVGSSPDPDYACGADHCDDPACTLHGHRRAYTPHGPPDLTAAESATVTTIRALVIPDSTPDPAMITTISSLARDYHAAGLPFNQTAVLATLYPGWTRAAQTELLINA